MYGLIVWGSCNKTLFDELEGLHTRATRIIFRLDWRMPTEVVLNTVKWKPLRHIYFQRLLVLAYKCYYALMPGLLEDLLVKHETRYCLRKQLCLNIPISKTDMVKKSIQYMSAVLWNKLGNEMRRVRWTILND